MNPVLIFGGAGFVGTNLALSLIERGQEVVVFDNLSRKGVEDNLETLQHQAQLGRPLTFIEGDIRDFELVSAAVKRAGSVVHLAAQVAVTTSLVDPLADFEINARGTLHILEAVRLRSGGAIPVVFTSTNKVYGALDDISLELLGDRYAPQNLDVASFGIGEARPLDFHSPYGCSKGAADQYVLDYARSFDIPACVFRMSCIYGPHQKGNEDQGWVAHFLLQALRGEPITLFGDGKQVRDILWVGDLVRAFHIALDHPLETQAQPFNLGGGPDNTVSLLEVVDAIEQQLGEKVRVDWGDWRVGDQRYYVSDTRRFEAQFGWRAQTGAREGIAQLCQWMQGNADVSSQTKELVS